MATTLDYGLYTNQLDPVVTLPVKASSTWDAGAFLKLDAGYLTACSAGDVPFGVAVHQITTAQTPATSGNVSAQVYVGPTNIYQYPPDTGTVVVGDVGKKMDVGGARSVNRDASADGALRCVGVDVDAQTLFVQLIPSAAAGA